MSTRPRIRRAISTSIIALCSTACAEPSSSLTPGEETAACNDGQCLGSLECRSDHCVDPDWEPPQATSGNSEDDDDNDSDNDDDNDSDTSTDDSGPGDPVTAIDLLFVLDDSGSMGVPQLELTGNISSLTTPLLDAGLDVRVAVTTADAGNLWCTGAGVSAPENGMLVSSSCRTRLNEFQFNGFGGAVDATPACTEHCPEELAQINFPEPWVPNSSAQPGLSLQAALACLLPQGVAGCGFESTLESMRLALAGSDGFLRDNAHLAVVIISDEADCSFNRGPGNQIMNAVFGADGSRTFWSLPDEQNAPTSAVCWNAGVSCSNGACDPVDLTPTGAATTDPAAASLHPVQNYIDVLAGIRAQKQGQGAELFVFGVLGVPTDYDGTLVYTPGPNAEDPSSFQARFGIGPGCTATLQSLNDENGDGILDENDQAVYEAVPPIRMRAVIEDPEIGGQLFSICADDYGPALSAMAAQITSSG